MAGCGGFAADSKADVGQALDGTPDTALDAHSRRPVGWEYLSHGKGAPPAYEMLFIEDVVHRVDIEITAENHAVMIADLTDKLGQPGKPDEPRRPPDPPPQEGIEACTGKEESQPCSFEFEGEEVKGKCKMVPFRGGTLFCQPKGKPPPGAENLDWEPVYVPVTVHFGGKTWTHVGMRYKGNSSLRTPWQIGKKKLGFRLHFDKYEDDYPEIQDQRFYGFKKMVFTNNWRDDSFLRDKMAAEFFRAGGVPAAHSAFCRVYVDVGDGAVYWGLYTMIEDPSNKMLDTQFLEDGGNLYKPEGPGADWTVFDKNGFEKKTNEEQGDWNDVEAAISALHSDRSDREAWCADLDALFDVSLFLKFLAINTAIQNWDSYGQTPQNYYVYGDPGDGGRLKWIPWDLSEAMMSTGTVAPPLSLTLDEVGDDWPLIRYILDTSAWREEYVANLGVVIEAPFALEPTLARMEALHNLISPYVVGEEGESGEYTLLSSPEAFLNSLTDGPNALKPHVEARHQAVKDFLAEPNGN